MNKYLVVLFSLMLVAGFVSAQGGTLENIEILPGESIESDLDISDSSPEENLGGLISSTSYFLEKYVSFGPLQVWRAETNITAVENFTLFAFPIETENPQIELLENDGVFESSEEVEIRGTDPHIWITNNVFYVIPKTDPQNLGSENEQIFFESGAWIKITDLGGSSMAYESSGGSGSNGQIACDESCPEISDVESAFNLTYGVDFDSMTYGIISELSNTQVIIIWQSGGSVVGIFLDWNLDGEFSLVDEEIYGLQVDSFQTQSLLLAEPKVYNAYIMF